jgi:hypothetical protein
MLTGRADVDIRYVLLKDLGRTTTAALDNASNHIGRYSLHAHHLIGPTSPPANGYQFTLIGNAVDGGSSSHRWKWGITIHNSHYGLIQSNVMYNWGGTLMMFEDGSESYNVVENNFGVRSTGVGDRLAEGTEGGGFWFRGPNNYVRNNVAANLWGDTTEAAYGFKFFMRYLGTVNLPKYQGADTSVTGQFQATDGNTLPIREFLNNEVYGSAQGFTYWWINSQDPAPNTSATESVIQNLKIWHVYNKGVYHYPAAKVTFDGLTIRGKDPDNAACCGQAWHGEDYAASDVKIRNSDIQGMMTGVKPSTWGTQTIENSVLINKRNVQMQTLYSANGGGGVPPRRTILRNDRFQAWGTSGLLAVDMDWDPKTGGQANTTQSDTVLVYAYNLVSTDNFQTYYAEQGTQSVAGGLAPCTTTRAGIGGIACPIPGEPAGTTPPPAAPSNLRIIR